MSEGRSGRIRVRFSKGDYDCKGWKNDQKIQNEVVKEMLDAGCEILAVDLVDRTEPSNIIKMAKRKIYLLFSLIESQ